MLAPIRAHARHAAAAAVVTFVLVTLGAAPARAAEELDQSQFETEEMYCIEGEPIRGCATKRFQTVTAGQTGGLVAVELYLGRQSYTTDDLVIEIRDDVDGDLLATSLPVAASDVPVLPEAGATRFTFAEPPVLRTREVFSIVIPSVSDDGDEAWAWGGTVDDPHRDRYTDGDGWECDQGGACFLVGLDYAFATFVDATVVATPAASPTPTATSQPTAATQRATPTPTPAPTAQPTRTPTPTPTPIASVTPSATVTPTASATPDATTLPATLADDQRSQEGSGLVAALVLAIIGLVAVTATGVSLWLRRQQARRLPRAKPSPPPRT